MNLPGTIDTHSHAVSILAWLQQDTTFKLAITTALLAACLATSLWLTRYPPDEQDRSATYYWARRLLPATLAVPAALLAILFIYIAVTGTSQ